MPDIFISYSSADRPVVSGLANALERAGFDVWWDPEIPPGKRYEQVIDEALHEAKAVVVCWSTNSVQSEWVYEEADHAKSANKLVPVFLEQCRAPIGFRMRQGANFEHWTGEDTFEWQSLLKSLEPLVGTTSQSAQPTQLQQAAPQTEQAPSGETIDLRYNLALSLEEAFTGTEKDIEIPYDYLDGETRKLRVNIPAGVDTGTRIRLSGEGERAGDTAGDLYIHIETAPHPTFTREENDLFCKTPLPFATAALGGHLDIQTLDGGRVRIKIPAGTQSGQQFRVRGKGMPDVYNKGTYGDLFIELHVSVPQAVSPETRALIEKLSQVGAA